jgi:hypothetical protein
LHAQAVDNAGNVATADTTFTVTVTAPDLVKLTNQFVAGSAKYRSSSAITRLVVSAQVTVTSSVLLSLTRSASPAAKARLVAAYDAELASLVAQGYLTTAQRAALVGLAGAI